MSWNKTEIVQNNISAKTDESKRVKLTPEEKAQHKAEAKERAEYNTREKARFTAMEIFVWAQVKSNVPYKEIASKIKKGVKQVQRYHRKIDEMLKGDYDLESYRRLTFFGNVYQALDNVGWLLAKRDPQMTLAFMKGMGLFKEYVDGGKPPGLGLTREELDKEIIRICSANGIVVSFNRNPQAGLSRFVAGNDTPPQHLG